MYLDLLDGKKYNLTLQYLISKCDEVTFHFPILDKKSYDIEELSDDYKIYIDQKQKFLKELFSHGATQNKSKVYLDTKLGFETQIIRVKLYSELVEKFKSHHLFDWLWWNGSPEDPCFFLKGNVDLLLYPMKKYFIFATKKQINCLCNN